MASNVLYCTICDTLLRTAMVLPCCQSPCCNACAELSDATSAGDCCRICGKPRPRDNVLRQDATVRKVAGSVSTRCPNFGCGLIMRQDEVAAHCAGVCRFQHVYCVFAENGCTAKYGREAMREHQTNACTFRDVSCPQRCGLSLPARDAIAHVDRDCPRTLVPCPNRCGQEVQRGLVGEHDSVCPVRPRSCPYRPFGCDVHGAMTSAQLDNHMAVSIHHHLLLLDDHVKHMGGGGADAPTGTYVPTCGGPLPAVGIPRYEWDASYVQNVGKWPAQPNTINALALLGDGEWLVSGCERGNLMAFSRDTGALVSQQIAAGVSPVRSMLGTRDGRLLVGYGDCTVQAWMCGDGAAANTKVPIATRVNQQMVMPTRRHLTKGITHMAVVRLPRSMLLVKPSLLLVEGGTAASLSKARAASACSMRMGSAKAPHCFEALVCLLDDQVAILEESMLQVILTVRLFKEEEGDGDGGVKGPALAQRRSSLCMTVVGNRWAMVGCSDGSVRSVDLWGIAGGAASAGGSPTDAAFASHVSVAYGNVFAGLRERSPLEDTAITAITSLQLRGADAASSPSAPSAIIVVGGSKGSIVLFDTCFDMLSGVVDMKGPNTHTSGDGSGPCAVRRLIPSAHKGPILSLVQVDGRHFASGGADECWRLWGPQLVLSSSSSSRGKAVLRKALAEDQDPNAVPCGDEDLSDDDDGPLQVPAVDLPSSMYACVVADNVLYAAGGQGLVKEWTATTLRYVRRT